MPSSKVHTEAIEECAEKSGRKPLKVWRCLKTLGYSLSLNDVKRALASLTEKETEQKAVDEIVYRPPRVAGPVSANALQYPPYTVAEALYLALYETDPNTAHEKMYELLEPILLSNTPLKVRQYIFVPVSKETWGSCVASLKAVIENAGDENRRIVCENLRTVLRFMVASLPPAPDGVMRASFPEELKEVCEA